MNHSRLRTPEAARFLGLAPKTLEKMRSQGDGPSFFRVGTAVIYDQEDLSAWLEKHRVNAQSQSQELDRICAGGDR